MNVAAFVAMHNPEARHNPMVYSVWEDGEITLEKGGELFGLRTLHCTTPGSQTYRSNPDAPTLPIEQLPMPNHAGTHGRILVDTYEQSMLAHRIAWPDSPY